MKMPEDPKNLFLYFIHERDEIRLLKDGGRPGPWTDDSILNTYRFCNVNREDDAVTRWIQKHIRAPFKDDPDLWFALIVARLINQPSTLDRIYRGSDASWDKKWFLDMTDPESNPKPIFNAAYIVSTNGVAMQKNEYVAKMVLDPLWKAAQKSTMGGGLLGEDGADCQKWADWLLRFQGMGDFMVNQIVTDYKYTRICRDSDDWTHFVMAGPGTRRGLNRYFGRDKSDSIPRDRAQMELKQIRRDISKDCSSTIEIAFNDLNNLSNCFCEFDKYMRALTGDGTPKQLYRRAK